LICSFYYKTIKPMVLKFELFLFDMTVSSHMPY
jgi:hypothetical protein